MARGQQLRHKVPRPINQFFYQSAEHPLDDRINEWMFPHHAVPPGRPDLGDGDGGKREREGHRSCVDSEVRSHSFILPFASDKTLLPEFVQRIASVNYVLQERCPFESDVDPIVLSDA